MPLEIYQSLLSQYSNEYTRLNRKLRFLGFIRLLIFLTSIVSGYYYFRAHESYWLVIAFSMLALFFILVRLYQRTKDKSDFINALIAINKTEIDFINGHPSIYENGEEYTNTHHPYSYDLDLFGKSSLYAFLNRTTTSYGKESLANSLLHPDTTRINERQQSIKELAGKINFRQHLQASGSLHVIEQGDMEKLKAWLRIPAVFKNPVFYYLLLIFPAATIASLVLYFSSDDKTWLNLFSALFILNFLITAIFLKQIMNQVSLSTAVGKVLVQFARQLKEIEEQSFDSALAKELRNNLRQHSLSAAGSIKKLTSLFRYLDFIINPVMSTVLNGLSLFHLHILFALDNWKKKNDQHVSAWLNVIGEFESLNSLANLAFNNPGYCYPEISKEEVVITTGMGHPLIRMEKNITNDISFQQQRFVVLTGSNMSGKSTFLRTLGTNIVLAKAGSVVCAETFVLYPFDLFASMRITDSLQDSESFFYAELKRLNAIIEHLEANHKTFVMLDEILRGTNSNDKHSGTVGLIRKMVANKACGIIATHDLTIGNLSLEYPGYMGNKCFESEIINGELVFDYKLKDGVCTRLNASFLMKKMGIID